MPDDSELLAVLESLRERGALGEASLPSAVAHADSFLAAIPSGCARLIDLGSGGGLPGLVLAWRCPDAEVVLTDRRERRMDLLRLACARLGFGARVSVVTADVVELGRSPGYRQSFDVVTARAFGDSVWTATCASAFLNASGVVIVSEPPDSDPVVRWPTEALALVGLRVSSTPFAQVIRLERI